MPDTTKKNPKRYKALSLVSIEGSEPVSAGEIVTTEQHTAKVLSELASAGVLEVVKDEDPEPAAEAPAAPKPKGNGDQADSP